MAAVAPLGLLLKDLHAEAARLRVSAIEFDMMRPLLPELELL